MFIRSYFIRHINTHEFIDCVAVLGTFPDVIISYYLLCSFFLLTAWAHVCTYAFTHQPLEGKILGLQKCCRRVQSSRIP